MVRVCNHKATMSITDMMRFLITTEYYYLAQLNTRIQAFKTRQVHSTLCFVIRNDQYISTNDQFSHTTTKLRNTKTCLRWKVSHIAQTRCTKWQYDTNVEKLSRRRSLIPLPLSLPCAAALIFRASDESRERERERERERVREASQVISNHPSDTKLFLI